MTEPDKTLKALQIIAGIQPAWAHWKLFIDEEVPKYDKTEGVQKYQDALSTRVRAVVCTWLAERLNEVLSSYTVAEITEE